jgi:hypothetical protein
VGWLKNLISGSDDWESLEKKEADKQQQSKAKRFSKGRSKKDDIINVEVLHTFLVKSVPESRMVPRNCMNFSIKIFSTWIELICYTKVGQERIFRYILEEPFLDGIITLTLDEQEFHSIILRQRTGLFQIVNRRKVLVNQKFEYKIKKYALNGEVIV